MLRRIYSESLKTMISIFFEELLFEGFCSEGEGNAEGSSWCPFETPTAPDAPDAFIAPENEDNPNPPPTPEKEEEDDERNGSEVDNASMKVGCFGFCFPRRLGITDVGAGDLP